MMYRFLLRPKWIAFHLLCLLGVVLMVNFSIWQFGRLSERREFNSEVRQRSALETVNISELDLSDPLAVQWRSAGAIGTYDPSEQVLILNRSQNGVAGLNVVTPLILDDGRAILVNRGFIGLSETPPSAPSGTVRVLGTVQISDQRTSGQATQASGEQSEFFRLDIALLGEQIDYDLLPVALVAIASEPSESPTLAPINPPELSQGPHLSYAIQWLIFSAAVIVGWVLAIRKSLANRALTTPSA
ncbi:MAG: SURF1 family protein [Ilumatobacteraceae bacterium]|nr:SURF1 family protein [Ilumatobacteraceae bacterium]